MKKIIAMMFIFPCLSVASPMNKCLDVGRQLDDHDSSVALLEVGKYVGNNKEVLSHAQFYNGNYYIFKAGKIILAAKNSSKVIFATHSSGDLEYPTVSIQSCKVSSGRELLLFSLAFDEASTGSAAALETNQGFIYDTSLGVTFKFSKALNSSAVNSVSESGGDVYYINDSYVQSPLPQESFADSKRYLVNRTVFKLENKMAKPIYKSRDAYVQSKGEPFRFFDLKYFNKKFNFDKIIH